MNKRYLAHVNWIQAFGKSVKCFEKWHDMKVQNLYIVQNCKTTRHTGFILNNLVWKNWGTGCTCLLSADSGIEAFNGSVGINVNLKKKMVSKLLSLLQHTELHIQFWAYLLLSFCASSQIRDLFDWLIFVPFTLGHINASLQHENETDL